MSIDTPDPTSRFRVGLSGIYTSQLTIVLSDLRGHVDVLRFQSTYLVTWSYFQLQNTN